MNIKETIAKLESNIKDGSSFTDYKKVEEILDEYAESLGWKFIYDELPECDNFNPHGPMKDNLEAVVAASKHGNVSMYWFYKGSEERNQGFYISINGDFVLNTDVIAWCPLRPAF